MKYYFQNSILVLALVALIIPTPAWSQSVWQNLVLSATQNFHDIVIAEERIARSQFERLDAISCVTPTVGGYHQYNFTDRQSWDRNSEEVLESESFGSKSGIWIEESVTTDCLFNISRAGTRTRLIGDEKRSMEILVSFWTLEQYIQFVSSVFISHYIKDMIERFESEVMNGGTRSTDDSRIFRDYIGDRELELGKVERERVNKNYRELEYFTGRELIGTAISEATRLYELATRGGDFSGLVDTTFGVIEPEAPSDWERELLEPSLSHNNPQIRIAQKRIELSRSEKNQALWPDIRFFVKAWKDFSESDWRTNGTAGGGHGRSTGLLMGGAVTFNPVKAVAQRGIHGSNEVISGRELDKLKAQIKRDVIIAYDFAKSRIVTRMDKEADVNDSGKNLAVALSELDYLFERYHSGSLNASNLKNEVNGLIRHTRRYLELRASELIARYKMYAFTDNFICMVLGYDYCDVPVEDWSPQILTTSAENTLSGASTASVKPGNGPIKLFDPNKPISPELRAYGQKVQEERRGKPAPKPYNPPPLY